MRRLVHGLVAAIVFAGNAGAFAQQGTAPGSTPQATPSPPASPNSGGPAPLAQQKQIILGIVRQEVAILQRLSACVQAADNPGTLRVCMIQRRVAEDALRQQELAPQQRQ